MAKNDLSVLLITKKYIVTARPRSWNERSARSRVYVSDLLSDQDEKLHALSEQEANLGDDRWSHRGEKPKVDKLYDRLNRRVATVKRQLALEAVRQLVGYENINGSFSRYAGCSCKCSPGVVLGRHVYVDGQPVDLWLSVR